MVAEVSRPAAGALWCNSAPWLTNLEAFSITYFAASRAGLWTVCSMANRVWRGGNRTHMFSRHRVFVSCQRHVCSLCVNVTPSVRMSVASMAGENWLRRSEELTFFLLFFFRELEFSDTTSEESFCRLTRWCNGGLFHPRCTSTLLHLASEKRSLPNKRCWNWREMSLTNRNPTEGEHPSLWGWTLQTSLRRAQANSSG